MGVDDWSVDDSGKINGDTVTVCLEVWVDSNIEWSVDFVDVSVDSVVKWSLEDSDIKDSDAVTVCVDKGFKDSNCEDVSVDDSGGVDCDNVTADVENSGLDVNDWFVEKSATVTGDGVTSNVPGVDDCSVDNSWEITSNVVLDSADAPLRDFVVDEWFEYNSKKIKVVITQSSKNSLKNSL